MVSRNLGSSDEAIFIADDVYEIDQTAIEFIKQRASDGPRGRFRICLHHTTESLTQEMIIAFHGETYIRPHRHPQGKTESYHLIEGGMTVLLFDDLGTVSRRIELGEYGSGKSYLYRLSNGIWHMPLPRSDWVVYHETFTGPFLKDVDVEYASWAPEEDDSAGATVYLEKLREEQ